MASIRAGVSFESSSPAAAGRATAMASTISKPAVMSCFIEPLQTVELGTNRRLSRRYALQRHRDRLGEQKLPAACRLAHLGLDRVQQRLRKRVGEVAGNEYQTRATIV